MENLIDDLTLHGLRKDKDETILDNGCRRFVWDNIELTREVLTKFITAGLTVSVAKSLFGVSQAKMLGTTVDAYGTSASEDHLEKLHTWGKPKRVCELRGFLSACSWICQYMPGLGELCGLLSDLLKGSKREG